MPEVMQVAIATEAIQTEKKGSSGDGNQDLGLSVIRSAESSFTFTEAEDREVARKIDIHLLPLMGITFLFQYLDKAALLYASLLGIIKDNHLTGNQFAWLTTIFFIGNLVGEFPVNFLFQKLHITRSCGVLIFIWGVIVACTAAANSFKGLMVARFFIGLVESGAAPCFVQLGSMFNKRSEQPVRTSIWYGMSGVASIIGGLIAFGMTHIHGKVPAWKFPFIVFGVASAIWGIVFFFLAAPNPVEAKWLSPRQKLVAVERVAGNQTGIDNKTFKWSHAREAFTDLKVWLLFLFTLAVTIPAGGVTAFSGLIIQGFGFSVLRSTLLTIPSGVITVVSLVISGFLAGKFKNSRLILMAGGSLIGVLGASLIYGLPAQKKNGRLIGLYILAGNIPSYALSLGLIQANVGGRTKKTVVTSLMFISYCVGNLIGPQLFFTREAPRYQSGFIAMIVCLAAQIIIIALLYATCKLDNQKRDKLQEGQEAPSQELLTEKGLSDLTDKENPYFRYVL